MVIPPAPLFIARVARFFNQSTLSLDVLTVDLHSLTPLLRLLTLVLRAHKRYLLMLLALVVVVLVVADHRQNVLRLNDEGGSSVKLDQTMAIGYSRKEGSKPSLKTKHYWQGMRRSTPHQVHRQSVTQMEIHSEHSLLKVFFGSSFPKPNSCTLALPAAVTITLLQPGARQIDSTTTSRAAKPIKG